MWQTSECEQGGARAKSGAESAAQRERKQRFDIVDLYEELLAKRAEMGFRPIIFIGETPGSTRKRTGAVALVLHSAIAAAEPSIAMPRARASEMLASRGKSTLRSRSAKFEALSRKGLSTKSPLPSSSRASPYTL